MHCALLSVLSVPVAVCHSCPFRGRLFRRQSGTSLCGRRRVATVTVASPGVRRCYRISSPRRTRHFALRPHWRVLGLRRLFAVGVCGAAGGEKHFCATPLRAAGARGGFICSPTAATYTSCVLRFAFPCRLCFRNVRCRRAPATPPRWQSTSASPRSRVPPPPPACATSSPDACTCNAGPQPRMCASRRRQKRCRSASPLLGRLAAASPRQLQASTAQSATIRPTRFCCTTSLD